MDEKEIAETIDRLLHNDLVTPADCKRCMELKSKMIKEPLTIEELNFIVKTEGNIRKLFGDLDP